jgi:hypothetical protein
MVVFDYLVFNGVIVVIDGIMSSYMLQKCGLHASVQFAFVLNKLS